jgi:hypothetical protein
MDFKRFHAAAISVILQNSFGYHFEIYHGDKQQYELFYATCVFMHVINNFTFLVVFLDIF